MAVDSSAYREALAQFRRRYLMAALERNKWNRSRTAISIGIHRNSLLRMIVELGIKREVPE